MFTINNEKNISNVRIVFNNSIYADYEMREPIDDVGVDSNVIYICYKDPIGTDSGTPMSMHGFYEVKEDSTHTYEISNNGYRVTAINKSTGSRLEYDMQTFVTRLVAEVDPYINDFTEITEDQAKAYTGNSEVYWIGNLTDGSPFMFKATTIYEVQLAAPRFGEPHAFMYDPRNKKFKSVLNNIKFKEVRFPITNLTDSAYDDNDTLYIMSPSSVSSHGQPIYFNPTRRTVYEMKENGILGTQLIDYDDKYFTWSWDLIESLAISLYNSRSDQTEIEIGGMSSSSYDYGTKLSFTKGAKGFHVGNIVVQQLSNQSICDPVFFIPAYDLYSDYTYRSDGCPSAFLYKRINGQFKLVGPSIVDTPELTMAYNYPEDVILRKYRYVTRGTYSITDNSTYPPVETLVKLGRVVGYGFNEAALQFTGGKYEGDFVYQVYGNQYHISKETLLDKILKGKELISGSRRHRCIISQDTDAWARNKDVILYMDTNDYSLHLDYVRDIPENTIELYSRNNLLDTYDKITSKAIIDVEDIEDVADPREDCFYREHKEAEPTDNYIRTGRVTPDTPEVGYYSIYGYDMNAGEQVYPVTWMEQIDDSTIRMFIQSRPQFGDQVYYLDSSLEQISSILMGTYEGSPIAKWHGVTGSENPSFVVLSTTAGAKFLKSVYTGDTKDPNRTSFYIIYDKLAEEFKFNILSKDNRDAFDPYEEYPLDEGTEKKPVLYHRLNDEWHEVGGAVIDTEDIDKEDSGREGVIFREDNSVFKTKGEIRGVKLGYVSAYINEDDTYCGIYEGGRYELTYLEHGTTYKMVDLGYWDVVDPALKGPDTVISTASGDVKIKHTGDVKDAHVVGRLVYNTYRDELEVDFFEDYNHSVNIPDPNIGYYNFINDTPEKLNSAIVDVKGLNDIRDPRPDMLYRVKPNFYTPIPESEGAYVAVEITGGMNGASNGATMDFTRTDRNTITVKFKYKNKEEVLTITDGDIADKDSQIWAMKRVSFFGSESYIDVALREYNEVTEWNENKRSTVIARRRDKNTQVVPPDYVYLFDSKKDVEDNVTYGIPGIYHYEEDQWKKVGSSIIAYEGNPYDLTAIDEDAIYRVHNWNNMSDNGLYYRFDGEWQKFSRGVVDVNDTIATEFSQEDNIIFRDKNYLNNYKYDGVWNGVKLGYFSIKLRDYPSGEVIVDYASGRMSIWMEGFNGVLTTYEDYEEISDLPQLLRDGSTEIHIPIHDENHMYSGSVVGIIEYTGTEFKYETAGRVWFDGNNIQMTSFKGCPEKYDILPSTTNWYNLVDGKFEKINGSIIDVDSLNNVQNPREDYIYRINPAQLTCEDDESYIILFNDSYEFVKSHIQFSYTKPWDPRAEVIWIQYKVLHSASEFEITKTDIANSNGDIYHYPYREIYGPVGTFKISLGRTKTPENYNAIVLGKINDNDDVSTLVFFDNEKEGEKAKNGNTVSGLWHYHNDQWNKLGGGKINVVDKLEDVDLDDHDNFTFIPGGSSSSEFITDIGHRFTYNGNEYACGYTRLTGVLQPEGASTDFEFSSDGRNLFFKDSLRPAEYSYLYHDEDITEDKLSFLFGQIQYETKCNLLVYYDDKWYDQQPNVYKYDRTFTLKLDPVGGNYNSTSSFYIYTDRNNKLYIQRIYDDSEFHPRGETPPSGELLVHAADGQLHIVSSGSSSGTAFTVVERMQDMVDTSKVYALEYKRNNDANLRNYKFFAWVKGLWDEYGWNQISCSGIAPWDGENPPSGNPATSYHATDRFYYDMESDAIYAPCGNHWITIKNSGNIIDVENVADISDTNQFYRYKQNINGDIQAYKFVFSPSESEGPGGRKLIGPCDRSRLEYISPGNVYLQVFDSEGTGNPLYAEYTPEENAGVFYHWQGIVTSGIEDDIYIERLGTDRCYVHVAFAPCDLSESDFVWWTKADGTEWRGSTKEFLPLYDQDVEYIESIMYAPLNDEPRAVGGPIEITKELYDTITHVKDQIYLIDIED